MLPNVTHHWIVEFTMNMNNRVIHKTISPMSR